MIKRHFVDGSPGVGYLFQFRPGVCGNGAAGRRNRRRRLHSPRARAERVAQVEARHGFAIVDTAGARAEAGGIGVAGCKGAP